MNKLLFAISIAKKAGKLVFGFDSVKKETLSGKTYLVLLTSDVSEKTVKRVKFFCEDITEVHQMDITQYELSQIANRLTGVVAITDENMAILCQNAINK